MKNINFLSPYGSALALIAENPSIRISEIATRFQLSERAARRIISDLVQAKYLYKNRQGFYIGESTELTLINAISAIEQSESAYTYPQPAAADNKRQQTTSLLVASIETLINKGITFWELSVEDIIAEAQISRSTFYLYFKDKATLLEIMLEKIMVEMLDNPENRNALIESKTQQDLAIHLKALFKSYRPHRHILSAAIEAGHKHPNISQLYRKYIQQAIGFLATNINRKGTVSAINTDLSNEWSSIFIVWGIEDCLNSFYLNASSKKLAKLAEALAETIWPLLITHSPQDNNLSIGK